MRNKYRFLQIKLFFNVLVKGRISFRKVWNVFSCTFRYLIQSKKSGTSPFILSLELGNECNANCLFCRDEKGKIYDMDPEGKEQGIVKGKMPLEMACDAVEQLQRDLVIAVLYTNGEPLLYQDLHKVIQFCSDRNVASMIATNAILLNESKIRQILSSGLDFIKVQFSGFTQDIYSVQVRFGDIEKIKENIRLLAKINKEGKYKAVVMADFISYEYNEHQLDLVREFCDELGIMLSVRPGNPKGGLEDKEPPLQHEELPLKCSCDWLWKGMQINWNGDILPCCDYVIWSGLKSYHQYKIGETNLLDVWNSEPVLKMRKTLISPGRKAISICAECTRKAVYFKW